MKTFLAIDVGTSSTKLSLFDEQGRFITAYGTAYSVDYPRPEWGEQDPEAWWRAVRELGPRIMAANEGHSLAGISVSGQTPGCAPVDEEGLPLRPAILWLDRRAGAQVGWLREQVGEEACRAAGKNRLDSYFGGVKWLWFRQSEPRLFERTWKLLQANGFVIYRLTGQTVIDPAQAGLCSPCFNLALGDWDEPICRAMGLYLPRLPEVRPAWSVAGAVTAAAARQTGLPEGTPVVCGGADFACAALGTGVLASGGGPLNGAMMLGTAGNLLFPGAQSDDPRLLHTIHLTGDPLPFGGVMAGGNLSWFATLMGDEGKASFFQQLDQEAAQVPPGCEGLIFLPYLMGERTPIWDPGARGAYVGLSSRHTRAHLYRAILEGVAFAFRQIRDIVGASSLGAITAIDGGARSPLWRSILASALGAPLRQGGERSGTALGSAFLAALGTGAVPSFEAIHDWVEVAGETSPDPSAGRVYDRIYPVYEGLYAKLKDDFDVLRG